MAWSNEKLKIPNQAVALGLEQALNDVSTSFLQDGIENMLGTSFIGDLSTSVATGVASNIITGIIKARAIYPVIKSI